MEEKNSNRFVYINVRLMNRTLLMELGLGCNYMAVSMYFDMYWIDDDWYGPLVYTRSVTKMDTSIDGFINCTWLENMPHDLWILYAWKLHREKERERINFDESIAYFRIKYEYDNTTTHDNSHLMNDTKLKNASKAFYLRRTSCLETKIHK